MLEYSFKLVGNLNTYAERGYEHKAVWIHNPEIETEYGRMPRLATDLALRLREHFTQLMNEGKPIPINFPDDDEDSMKIYMPSGTTWRIMLWNLFHSRGMTFESIAKERSIKTLIHHREQDLVEQYVRDVFNLSDGSKYRELLPFAQLLNVDLVATLVDSDSKQSIVF